MTTPSTPIAEVVDALAAHMKAEYYVQFGELAGYLESRGISVDGDEALTGENLRQPHVPEGTTMVCPVSDEYVQIVEGLFSTKPVRLDIGDLASFRIGEEPWYAAWTGNYDDV